MNNAYHSHDCKIIIILSCEFQQVVLTFKNTQTNSRLTYKYETDYYTQNLIWTIDLLWWIGYHLLGIFSNEVQTILFIFYR